MLKAAFLWVIEMKMGIRKRTGLIYGVGINDSEYVTQKKIKREDGSTYCKVCPIYQAWINMLKRCYSSVYQAKETTYIGCSVTPDWHSFNAFRAWMLNQPWEGRQLDKDAINPGNKVYGPDSCIFISQQLNLFLNGQQRQRGEWPIGVSWNEGERKFKAQCCDPFSRTNRNIGSFECPENAHEAWRKQKHKHALRYADMQDDPRLAAALRIRYLPENLHKIGI